MSQRMATAHHLISNLVPRLPGYFLRSTLAINHLLGTVRNGGIVKNGHQPLGVEERLRINKHTLCIHPVSTCHCTKLPNSGTVSKATWKPFSEMGSSVQFSSRWYLCTRKSPYVLHPIFQNFPQRCLSNGSTILNRSTMCWKLGLEVPSAKSAVWPHRDFAEDTSNGRSLAPHTQPSDQVIPS